MNSDDVPFHGTATLEVMRQTQRPAGLSLRKNFSWTFAGNTANTLAQFTILLALARYGSTQMVGQFGLGLALAAPVFLLAGMSFRNVLVTDAQNEYSFGEYATARFFCYLFGLLALTLIVIALRYPRDTALVILLLGITKIVEGMSDIIHGVFQRNEQMDLIAKSMIIRSVFTVIVFVGVLAGTGDLPISIASMAVIWTVRFFTYDVRNLIRMMEYDSGVAHFIRRSLLGLCIIPQHRPRIVALLLLSLPLGMSALLISLNTNIPRYVLEWSQGPSDLGVFTILSYPLVAGTILINALSQSSLPRLASYYALLEFSAFTTLLSKLLLIGMGLAAIAFLVAVAIGADLLQLLFGPQYAQEQTAFLVLVLGLGTGFVCWFLDSALQAMRAYRTMLAIQVVMLVVQLVASLILIPRHGLLGAACAVTVSLVIQAVVKMVAVSARLRRETQQVSA